MNRHFMKSPSRFIAPVCTAMLLAIAAAPAFAADPNPPDRLSYQSYLVDGNGNPLAPSAPKNYDVVFRIYNASSGGTLKWSEQQTVTVDKGNFSVLLGEGSQVGSEAHGSLANVFKDTDASDRYVAITVKGVGAGGADVDILPRVQLLTSPYAHLARNAVNAANLANSANAQIVSVTGTNVGINKALPAAPLDVVGAGQFTGNLTANNAFMGDLGYGSAWAGFSHKDAAAQGSYALLQNGNGLNTFINAKSGAGSTIEMRFDNLARVTLDPGGNMFISSSLGVGTAPNTSGTVSVGGNSAGFYFNERTGSSASGSWSLYANNGAAHLYSSVANVDRLLIENNGKIDVPGSNPIEFGYGFSKEINNGKIGYKTFSSGLDIVGAGSSAADRAVTMHVQGGGLTINGPTQAKSFVDSSANDGGYYFGERNNLSSRYCLYGHDGYATFWSSVGNRDLILISPSGYLGINRGPRCPLDVEGYANLYAGTYGYIAQNGAGGPYPANQYLPYSILASARVGGTEFNAFSDMRIKDVVGLSDTKSDLELIRKLRVTDYRMKDRAMEGEGIRKGFIAQEVKQIVPEAVTMATNTIPNIYAGAKKIVFDKENKTLALSMEKAPDLKKGDIVRLILEERALELPVTSVASTNLVLGEVKDLKETPKWVFVYGKQVPDFLSVNYDRLFTSGIGAIQELSRKLEASETRVAELEAKTRRVETLEKELSELKQLVAKLAAQQEKRAAGAEGPNLAAAHSAR